MVFIGIVVFSCATTSNTDSNPQSNSPAVAKADYAGEIVLYGESHGVKKILDKENELWKDYYQKGYRHLFIELAYYTAEYLNAWMKDDTDRILDELYADWKGTAAYNPDTYAFYKKIKQECPDTIFHGTDVGHQYDTTGKRFLLELEANNLTETENYELAIEAVKQGEKYYKSRNDVYRENSMVANFIRESERVADSNIVGIYGSAHTGLQNLDNSGKIPCMANQLKSVYTKPIQSVDLSRLAKDIEPLRIDKITINTKEYAAYYYGQQDLNGFKGFLYREFWMLDGAYDDFKNSKKTGDYLPYDNYPMMVEDKQIYVID